MTEDEKVAYTREELAKFCKGLALNKTQVFGALMADIHMTNRFSEGLLRMSSTIENGTDANVRKQLANTMISLSKLLDSQRRILSLVMIYLVDGDATSDAAKAAMRFGADGEEILQSMWNSKLRGKD